MQLGQHFGRFALALSGFAVAIGVWWFTAAAGVFGSKPVPTPGEVATAMVAGFAKGSDGLILDLRLSVLRVLIGVGIGCAAALPVGFLLAWYPTLRAMFDPLVSFFRALPPIALISLFIVYFGIGESARLGILTYAAFFAAIVVIYEGVSAIDDIYVRAGRAMGASEWELFRRIVVPLTVPQLFVALRVALGVCWATVVAAELIAAQRGLGWSVQRSSQYLRIEDTVASIILIGLAALVMDRIIRLVQNRMVRWQERVVR